MKSVIRIWAIILCIYVSGLALYSSLFVFSDNQFLPVQIAKVAIASLHCLLALVFVFMAQSRWLAVWIIGYLGLIAYFAYIFFLTGYFAYFGFVPELYALGLANAADVAGVTNHYFVQVFGWREVLLLSSLITLLFLLPRQKLPKGVLWVLLLPVGLFGINVAQFGHPIQSESFGNASVIRRFGLPTFYYQSVQEWMRFQSGYLAEETPFPGKLSALVDDQADAQITPVVPMLDPVQKVVLVQIESFDREAIGADLNGLAVMPFVANLKATSCQDYTNFYTTKSVGGSSDSEFSVATGRLPSFKRQSIRHADFSQMETIYDILSDQGIASYFAHNNNIGFYGRNQAYAQLPNVTDTFLSPNADVDERTFALSTLSDALQTSERMFYYFFNFKSHGPYQGYSSDTQDYFGIETSTDIHADYLATMHEVDQTIAAMFALQQADFDAGQSLFIVTADHPSYLTTDATQLSRNHIPLLLCHAGFEGAQNPRIASTVDLFPTLLEAFGLPDRNVSVGTSLLAQDASAVLFSNGTIVSQQDDGSVATTACGERCRLFFDYTDQAIKLSN